VTLHVGLDTFRPIEAERLEDHKIHSERYSVTAEAWERIRGANRVLAVGTTTVRVLETLASNTVLQGRQAPTGAALGAEASASSFPSNTVLQGRTSLFITPGYEFRRVDSLLTNFHLPRSSLLALVMAFVGVEETRRLYELAIEERYRFYSFGDAMLIR
jgi:S-adenosylmethionine:tRNA ribosyltransferase-isomerase